VDDKNDTSPDEIVIYGSRLVVVVPLCRCYCHAVFLVRKDSSVTMEVRVLVTLWAFDQDTYILFYNLEYCRRKQ